MEDKECGLTTYKFFGIIIVRESERRNRTISQSVGIVIKTKGDNMSKTITRKAILNAIVNSENIMNELNNAFGAENVDALAAALSKWNAALSKSTPKKVDEAQIALINEIVAYINTCEKPVTAKTINDKFVHSEKTNKASALLRHACAEGMISRDKVRKNANYEYAPVAFDWDTYIADYDNAMAAKAQARIERARNNRNSK